MIALQQRTVTLLDRLGKSRTTHVVDVAALPLVAVSKLKEFDGN